MMMRCLILIYLQSNLIVSQSLSPDDHLFKSSTHKDISELCHNYEGIKALGMESGMIADSLLRASSSHIVSHVGPQFARLNQDRSGGAWCPLNQILPDSMHSEWIEAAFDSLQVIIGIATQGRYGHGNGKEFVEYYQIFYTRQKNEPFEWILWKDVHGNSDIKGNIDTNQTKWFKFDNPIVGIRRIRIYPISTHIRTVCLRFELYGCAYQGPISYTIHKIFNQTSSWMIDNSYDGNTIQIDEHYHQVGGLGELTDGIKVQHSSTPYSLLNVGKQEQDWKWIGWYRSNETTPSTIRLEFTFDQIQNFQSISINSLLCSQTNVRTFVSIFIWFSLNNHTWTEQPIQAKYFTDNIWGQPEDLNIELHHLIGNIVRIEMIHNSSLLLISEVTFNSNPLPFNLNQPELNNLFEQVSSILHTTFENKSIELGIRYVMDDDRLLNGNHSFNNNSNIKSINVTQFSIILCLFILGLVIFSLITSFTIKKLNRQKSSFLEGKSGEDDFEDEIDLKNISKNITSLDYNMNKNEVDYATLDMTSVMQLSKTLPNKNQLTNVSLKNVKLNSRFYASSDMVGSAMQNIYGTPPGLRTIKIDGIRDPTMENSYIISQHDITSPEIINEICEIAAPVWNVPYYGIRVYSEAEVRILQNVGKSKFGDVLIGHVKVSFDNKRAVIRTVTDVDNITEFTDSMKHLIQLSQTCEKFVKLFGIIQTPTYFATITEHGDYDLNHYLQNLETDSLSHETLHYIANEIAIACAYLELLNQAHCDLATRNVIVYAKSFQIKLSDIGSFMENYRNDYYNNLPIRWMSPEAIFLSKFTSKSDVYSFGVCFWEILTYAECRPFDQLNDEELLSAKQTGNVQLPKPDNCSNEIYQLLLACWDVDEAARPSFHEICTFFQCEKKLQIKQCNEK